jgi:hypothetical protein
MEWRRGYLTRHKPTRSRARRSDGLDPPCSPFHMQPPPPRLLLSRFLSILDGIQLAVWHHTILLLATTAGGKSRLQSLLSHESSPGTETSNDLRANRSSFTPTAGEVLLGQQVKLLHTSEYRTASGHQDRLDGTTKVELRLSHMSRPQKEMRRGLTPMRQLQETRHRLREANRLGQRHAGTDNANKLERQDAKSGIADLERIPAVRERS